jgi:hypothetical protein
VLLTEPCVPVNALEVSFTYADWKAAKNAPWLAAYSDTIGAVRGSVLMALSTVNNPCPLWMSRKYWLSNVNCVASLVRIAMSNTFTAHAARSCVLYINFSGSVGLLKGNRSCMLLQCPTPSVCAPAQKKKHTHTKQSFE